jgi:hypothetical protein
MNQEQLREAGNRPPEGSGAVRARGMEAGGEVLHRTQVNPRKAGLCWVRLLLEPKPHIQSCQDGSGGGGSTKAFAPYPKRSLRVRGSGRSRGNAGSMPWEKSDHLVVAGKPGNAGGAKEVTS